MNRVKFFIDGFNVYHALEENINYHKYKWLDYAKLASLFVKKQDTIVDVVYFTAYAIWDNQKVNRHNTLITALRHCGVKIRLGKFQKVKKKCRECKKIYETFEEKKTDVNIAVEVLRSAVEDEFDTAILISCDSDLIPVIETIKNLYPNKIVGAIIPIGRKAYFLRQICDFTMKMKEKHLRSSMLPDPFIVSSKVQLKRPSSWN